MSDHVLELHGVSKVYGEAPNEVHALRDVDVCVGAGELVAVMGPSGSGKSTLLTIAGSLEEATEGEVRIMGTSLSGTSRNARAALRRRSIGYVFQDFNLLAGLTAGGRRRRCRGDPAAHRAVVGPATACVRADSWLERRRHGRRLRAAHALAG